MPVIFALFWMRVCSSCYCYCCCCYHLMYLLPWPFVHMQDDVCDGDCCGRSGGFRTNFVFVPGVVHWETWLSCSNCWRKCGAVYNNYVDDFKLGFVCFLRERRLKMKGCLENKKGQCFGLHGFVEKSEVRGEQRRVRKSSSLMMACP